jgi:hypothetical protein
MTGRPYSIEPLVAFCHPSPKGAIDSSRFCGVLRVTEPGLYWVWAELAWSDHRDDRVLYVSVRLSPKREYQ